MHRLDPTLSSRVQLHPLTPTHLPVPFLRLAYVLQSPHPMSNLSNFPLSQPAKPVGTDASLLKPSVGKRHTIHFFQLADCWVYSQQPSPTPHQAIRHLRSRVPAVSLLLRLTPRRPLHLFSIQQTPTPSVIRLQILSPALAQQHSLLRQMRVTVLLNPA